MFGFKSGKSEGWELKSPTNGIMDAVCHSWLGFTEFLNSYLFEYTGYVFRGHSSVDWELLPLLDRILESTESWPDPTDDDVRAQHLERFKFSIRGRRGANPPLLQNEDDWWALGQHYGLATPLLDWTFSPYVAAFFAFEGANKVDSEYCAIYALHQDSVMAKSDELAESGEGDHVLRFVNPLTDDNARLISQQGLFTRCLDGECVIDWVYGNFQERGNEGGAVLLRILVPSNEYDIALKNLNRMNINHLSLFPDLHGSSMHANTILWVEDY
ncbi:FRG domain-containing protein [Marinobacter nitratireducens]|uniref:FRG domain-containing protein n=1 Tax=Marinobacter nitratireducens TaxID=1137280 RepID=UPI0009DE70FB|nr:FRG domain-containing protein [Marinobacter nitratireducens]